MQAPQAIYTLSTTLYLIPRSASSVVYIYISVLLLFLYVGIYVLYSRLVHRPTFLTVATHHIGLRDYCRQVTLYIEYLGMLRYCLLRHVTALLYCTVWR